MVYFFPFVLYFSSCLLVVCCSFCLYTILYFRPKEYTCIFMLYKCFADLHRMYLIKINKRKNRGGGSDVS